MLWPLVFLLVLRAAAPAAALTVGFYNDAVCALLNATRTVWEGYCAGGLTVGDCWVLPAGPYFDYALANASKWAVLEEFAGGACPAQSVAPAGSPTAITTVPWSLLRAYLATASDCLPTTSGLFVKVLGGSCAAPPGTSLSGFANYTVAVITDTLNTGAQMGLYADAQCSTLLNTFYYVAGHCLAGLMLLDFGTDPAGGSWAAVTAVAPNLCPPLVPDPPLFALGGWAVALHTLPVCTYSQGFGSFVALRQLSPGTSSPLMLEQFAEPAAANCTAAEAGFYLPFVVSDECQHSYNDFINTPGSSSAIMQNRIVGGVQLYTVEYFNSVTNCSPSLKSATFLDIPLNECVGPTQGVVFNNSVDGGGGFGASIKIAPAPVWLSGPALAFALAHPSPTAAANAPTTAASTVAASAVEGLALGLSAAVIVLAAVAFRRWRSRQDPKQLFAHAPPNESPGSAVAVTVSPLAHSVVGGLERDTTMISWSDLTPDLDAPPLFGGFGVVLRATWHGGARVAVKLPLMSIKYGGLPPAVAALLVNEARGMIRAQHHGANEFVVRLHGLAHGRIESPAWDAVLMRARELVISRESGGSSEDSAVPLPALVFPPQPSGRQLDALVMSWEDGGSLSASLYPTSLRAPWPSSALDRLRIGTELAVGLSHLHEVGLVHGDLKPDNVLLNKDGHVRLADFGLAQLRNAASSESRLSTVQMTEEKRGTWVYMAPEMFRGVGIMLEDGTFASGAGSNSSTGSDGSGGSTPTSGGSMTTAVAAASRSTDVYAFGTLLYEVLTGTAPWKGYSEISRITSLVRGEGLNLAMLPLATPPAVREALARCLSPARSKRPNMTELRSTLERELRVAGSGRFDVFISHAWGVGARRKPLTDVVYSALRAEGLSVWLDSNEMGADLQASMRQGIAASDVVVVLVSPDYAASANCLFELREAARAGKPIVTCVVEPGFWRTWKLRGHRAVPDDHELVALAGLATRLYVDLGAASQVAWGTGTDVSDAERKTLYAPEALPRLLEQLHAAAPAASADGAHVASTFRSAGRASSAASKVPSSVGRSASSASAGRSLVSAVLPPGRT